MDLQQKLQHSYQAGRSYFTDLLSFNPQGIALWSIFTKSGVSIMMVAYANALFLSTYPRSYLPYSYGALAVLDTLISLAVAPFLAKRSSSNFASLFIQLTIIFVILFFILLLPLHLYWLPFLFTLFLLSYDNLLASLSWSTIRLSFDVISFKKISSVLTFVGVLSGILFGVLLAGILHYLSLQVVPWVFAGLLCISWYFSYRLRPQRTSEIIKPPKQGVLPLKYDLFRKLVICFILFALCANLVDYCLKFKLSTSFNSQGIGQFMGLFLGITQVLSLVTSFIILRYLIKRFSVTYLLAVLPTYWFICGIFVLIHPSLWTITIMAAGLNFLRPIHQSGRELVFSIFPSQVQIVGRLLATAIVSPALAILLFVILLLIGKNIAYVVLLVMVLCSIFIGFAIWLKQSYIKTLRNEVQLKRFHLADEYLQQQPHVVEESALHALTSNELSSIRFGLGLLMELPSIHWSPEIKNQLQSPYPDIRIDVCKLIIKHHMTAAALILLHQYAEETHPEVRWWIYCALAKIRPESMFHHAEKDINAEKPELRAGAICVLLNSKNPAAFAKGVTALKAMINAPAAEMRKYAILVLENTNQKATDDELIKLIKDDDINVSNAAILAAAKNMRPSLAPAIIDRMLQKGVEQSAIKALTQLGKNIIPLITNKITAVAQAHGHFEILLKVLGSVPGKEAERGLLSEINIARNSVANEIAHRVNRGIPLSETFKEKVLNLINLELKYLNYLETLKKSHLNNLSVTREIESRHIETKERILYWLATLTNTLEIIELMPIILKGSRNEAAEALELLSVTINNPSFKQLLTQAFISDTQKTEDEEISTEIFPDAWLDLVIKFSAGQIEGKEMEQMNKVFILRAVELFQSLPAEVLMLIAENAQEIEIYKGQKIFSEGEPGTGMYIVVSGEVEIKKDDKIIAQLKEHDFFGELALFDNAGRSATAIAQSDGLLLFIDTDTFIRITDDVPEVLRSVSRVLLRYLRKYIAAADFARLEVNK